VLQPVEILGINDGSIVGSDRHDAPSNKLLLPSIFGTSSPSKDGGDGLGGILVSRAYILLPSSAFVVVYFIVVTLWPLCILCTKALFRPLHSPMVCLVPLWIGHGPFRSLA
jgi:hypothetical protein